MVKQIIKEAMEKNPIGLKEAVEAELRTRVTLALEAKMKKEDEHEEDDEDEGDMDESFDLSDYTVEELEDFMMSEDFDQLDELSKDTLRSYARKASQQNSSLRKTNDDLAARQVYKSKDTDQQRLDTRKIDRNSKKISKRSTGISSAVDRLAK